eukprot:Skav211504  [mRNA]  locus=scaffold2188:955402:955641:+ [translate_table: standard]
MGTLKPRRAPLAPRQAVRFGRQMGDRSFDFGRRERGACFVESVTLEAFKSCLAVSRFRSFVVNWCSWFEAGYQVGYEVG